MWRKMSTARSSACVRLRGRGALTTRERVDIAGWPTRIEPVVDMIDVNVRTRAGCCAASACPIMLPIDTPTTWVPPIPSTSSSPAASRAISPRWYCAGWPPRSMPMTLGGGYVMWVDRPTSRLPKRMTR